MSGKKCLLFWMPFFFLNLATGQQRFTLSGYIKDKKSGEEIFGAFIRVPEVRTAGAVTNEYGFYTLSLPAGTYSFQSRITGYKDQTQIISLERNVKMDWMLEEAEIQLYEVEVVGSKDLPILSSPAMGTEKLSLRDVSRLPTLFGERDVLKIIQFFPGIKSAGEGNGNFHVRGGGADQNLILLDEAPVYNASHLLGFFSTFNNDVVKDATIIKGNSPAQYGGRLSSVLDVRMREGNSQKLEATGGLGLITSRLAIEGPIQKNKSSFLLSGRRSYADLFLGLSPTYANTILYFYDLNLKANYHIDENNRLFLSGYFGKDRLGLDQKYGVVWGNQTGTLRWNRTFSGKWFSNTSFIYSNFFSDSRLEGLGSDFNFNSRIRDWNLKQEFQYNPNDQNTLRFGFNSIHHSFMPARYEEGRTSQRQSRFGWENAVFISNTLKQDSVLTLEYGMRISSFTVLGEGRFNTYNSNAIADSVFLRKNALGKTYVNPEPRISASYRLFTHTTFKAAYSRNTQNVHLLSNSTSTYPTDQWIGSSYTVKPEICDQFSLGYFRSLGDRNYELSAETYFKYLQNQVDYKNGAELKSVPDVESELLFGIGRAYGLELQFKKNSGRLTGWLSYTLSRTERKIDGINNGAWYLARQDRLHEISVVSSYQLSSRLSLSGVFVYYTGNAVTFPRGQYEIDGIIYLHYPKRNADRMPAYHRFDISVQYEGRKDKKVESSWNFSLYNVYGRQNAYVITFEPQDFQNGQFPFKAMQTSLFRWVPGITYNFKF